MEKELKIEAIDLDDTTIDGQGLKIVNVSMDVLDFATSKNRSYQDFVYTDEYVETCSEVELPLFFIVGLAIGLGLILFMAGIMVFCTLRFRKKYQLLINEKSAPKAPVSKESK